MQLVVLCVPRKYQRRSTSGAPLHTPLHSPYLHTAPRLGLLCTPTAFTLGGLGSGEETRRKGAVAKCFSLNDNRTTKKKNPGGKDEGECAFADHGAVANRSRGPGGLAVGAPS